MNSQKAIVLMSGGLDSLYILAHVIELGLTPLVLHIEYGQKTLTREEKSYHDIINFYNIPKVHTMHVHAGYLGHFGGSSLTDIEIPVSKSGVDQKIIPSSYVPFRNTHLIAGAVSWAEVAKADYIYIGANEEDSPGYPDCRPAYYEAFNELIRVGTKDGKIKIMTPIIHMTKSEIISGCLKLKAPLELTWSCYEAQDRACGKCDSCELRLAGFKKLGLKDPIVYQQ